MTNKSGFNRTTAKSGRDSRSETIEVIEENRTHLQALAETDLPAAWIAATILEEADNGVFGE